MDELLATVRALRAPDGCPWDRKQTHASLRPYLTEEAAEAVDALTRGDDAAIRDELGDVLLQVAFHAVLAEERGAFDVSDIEAAVVAKMVRRHPHVFGPDRDAVRTEADLHRQWKAIKARESAERAEASRPGPDDTAAPSVPRSLPAAARAGALARVLGWEPATTSAAPDVPSADADPVGGVRGSAEALGDALLDLAIVAAHAGYDPETLLRDATVRREAGPDEASRDAGTPAASAGAPT